MRPVVERALQFAPRRYDGAMQPAPRYRLAISQPLRAGGELRFEGNAAHYLSSVVRQGVGATVALFNRTDGEWIAEITAIEKRRVQLRVVAQRRAPSAALDGWAIFAPIKGGRLETIIEKATELGMGVLQPVLTQRTIVDKVNIERAEAIAREAAEQCERTDWPDIRAPLKLARLLGDWPADRLLVYGDESGAGVPIRDLLSGHLRCREGAASPTPADAGLPLPLRGSRSFGATQDATTTVETPQKFAILTGPEGGFTPEEFVMLRHCKQARGVSLGPRILRADTALITLAALTASAWGDWHLAPRFEGADA
jgi:16S rRNA (uracil1498-N3)-methyltransferase